MRLNLPRLWQLSNTVWTRTWESHRNTSVAVRVWDKYYMYAFRLECNLLNSHLYKKKKKKKKKKKRKEKDHNWKSAETDIYHTIFTITQRTFCTAKWIFKNMTMNLSFYKFMNIVSNLDVLTTLSSQSSHTFPSLKYRAVGPLSLSLYAILVAMDIFSELILPFTS